MSIVTVSKKNLTEALFHCLEASPIRYAVLRNYESYPDFGHDIDLVVHHQDVHLWNDLAVKFANECKLDLLYQCNHWNTSNYPHHNIEVFRFYGFDPVIYLQVDLFHGFPLLSIPFASEEELLANVFRDERGFKRIEPNIEMVFKLFQVHRILSINTKENAKFEKYKKNILSHASLHTDGFEKRLCEYCFEDGVTALKLLENGLYPEFVSMMHRVKFKIISRYFWKHPIKTLQLLFNRMNDYISMFIVNQCGSDIKVFSHNDENARHFELLGRMLVEHAMIPASIKRGVRLPIWTEKKMLERGALIYDMVSDAAQADMVLQDNQEKILPALIKQINHHHHLLYEKEMGK